MEKRIYPRGEPFDPYLCVHHLTMPPWASDKKGHQMYKQLIALSPGLEERLNKGTEQEIFYIAEMVHIVCFI